MRTNLVEADSKLHTQAGREDTDGEKTGKSVETGERLSRRVLGLHQNRDTRVRMLIVGGNPCIIVIGSSILSVPRRALCM